MERGKVYKHTFLRKLGRKQNSMFIGEIFLLTFFTENYAKVNP
jgi:hypothetical protein